MLPIIKQPTWKPQCCPLSNNPLGNGNVAHHQTVPSETATLPIIKQPLENGNVVHHQTAHWKTAMIPINK